MNRKIEWLITIVDRGRGDKVAEVYQRHHVAVQLVTHGRGTATSKIMDVLGLDEPEKDIVLSLVPGALPAIFFARWRKSFILPGPGQASRFRFCFRASALRRIAASHTAGWSFACHRRKTA